MRRWFIRIFLALLILIALAAIIVQVLLWTDYPRQIVIAQIQRQLGLRVQAKEFSTGWLGHTNLKDVKLSLPLAEESFFDVPQLRVKHTSLAWLILSRNVDVESVELDQPRLVVRQDKAGRWNLQEVLTLVGRTTAGGVPEPGTKQSPPKLPALTINNGTVTIIDHTGKTAAIEAVNITGRPDGPLVYRYQGGVRDRIDVVGEVAPGEQWKHDVKLAIADVEPWLKDWLDNPPSPMHFKGNWQGIVDKGKVYGRLVIEEGQAEVGPYGASGTVMVETSGSSSIFRPLSLIVKTPNTLASQLQLKGGSIALDGQQITAADVSVSNSNTRAILNGSGDWAQRSAHLSAAWQQTLSTLKHEGTFNGTLTTLWPAGPQLEGTLVSRGDMPSNTWNGSIKVSGNGRSWQDMDWTVTIPQAFVNRKSATTQPSPGVEPPPLARIDNLTAHLNTHDKQITLTEISMPAAEKLMGRVIVDWSKPRWYVQTAGRTKAHPRGEDTIFDFDLEAYGDWDIYTLDHLNVTAEDVEFKARGDYNRNRKQPSPMDVQVSIMHLPSADALAKDPTIKGTLIATGDIHGTAYPADLQFASTVFARNLQIKDRPVGIADILIKGTATESVQFKSDQFDAFGGHWNLSGQWPGKNQALHLVADVKGLSLAHVAEAFKLSEMRGTLDGDWTFELPRLKRDRIEMTGNFVAADAASGAFVADTIRAQMSLDNSLLRIAPIDMSREKGSAQATIELSLDKPKQPIATFKSTAWPLDIPTTDFKLAVWAEAPHLDVDLEKKSAGGAFKARALVATTQTALGEASTEGILRGRVIDAQKLAIDAFAGHADGAARFDLDQPLHAMARLEFKDVSGERLADLSSDRLEGLTGKFSGQLTLDPSVAERAVEPLRLQLTIHPENAKYRAADVGEMKFSAFIGDQRFVLDKLPSEHDEPWNIINCAGGTLDVWARVSQEVDRRTQSHVTIRFDHLDLDQLVHAANPESEPIPGKLTGTFTLFGRTSPSGIPDLEHLNGEGNIELTESDLKNTDAIKVLYDALHVGADQQEPIGKGTAHARLEASTLTLEDLRYFNRGVEVRAWPIIHDVWNMPDSPLSGAAVGSARPLRDLKLPFLADVDQIMNVLQSNVTTIELGGTVREPKVRLVPFSEIGEDLKRFLLGDVNTEVRKKPQ